MSDDGLAKSLLLQALAQLSELDGKIGNLQGQANIIIAEQGRAAAGRKETHDRLRELEEATGRNTATLNRIEPKVDAHEQTYQRGLGAAWMWKALWGAIAGAAGAAFAMLAKKLGWL